MTDKKWHENEEFWETFQFDLFGKRNMEKAQGEVEKIEELLEIEPPQKILDLCCGIGRHSIPFAKKGYEVTGVDITEKYLQEARSKAKNNNLEIEFIQDDMRKYQEKEEFDIVVNLCTSFGYFEDREDDKKVLKKIYNSLKPGGRLLIEIAGKEIIASKFKGRDWEEKEINGEKAIKIEERKVKKDWSWLEDRWIVVRENGEKKEFDVSHRIYSAFELKQLMKKVGFTEINVYGNKKGDPYDQNAERLVVETKKPENGD